MQPTLIDWSYSAKPDPLCGSGATWAERLLAYSFALGVTVVLMKYFEFNESPLIDGWRYWAMVGLIFDIAGGVVANMLNSCKRFYHAPLQAGESGTVKIFKNPIAFTAFHIHPILVSLIFYGDINVGITWYALLFMSTALTHVMPLYLQRPFASAFIVMAIMGSAYGPAYPEGLEWFIPCLFLKIVLGHGVQEEPYRPLNARIQKGSKS